MKVLVVVALIFSSAYGLSPQFMEDAKNKAHHIAEECTSETGVSQDDLGNIKAMHGPATHEGKCFIACFQKHVGILNDNGKLDKESGLAYIETFKSEDEELYHKAHDVLEKCYEEVSDDNDYCETGLKFGSCLKQAAKEAGITEMVMN